MNNTQLAVVFLGSLAAYFVIQRLVAWAKVWRERRADMKQAAANNNGALIAAILKLEGTCDRFANVFGEAYSHVEETKMFIAGVERACQAIVTATHQHRTTVEAVARLLTASPVAPLEDAYISPAESEDEAVRVGAKYIYMQQGFSEEEADQKAAADYEKLASLNAVTLGM